MCLQSSKVHKIISMYLLCWGCTIVKCSCDICCSIKVLSTRINWKINKLLISIAIHISKGAKVTSQPVHMHYHFFCPTPKIQGRKPLFRAKITFQKYILGSNPEIPFPTPFWPTTFWYRLAPLLISKNLI